MAICAAVCVVAASTDYVEKLKTLTAMRRCGLPNMRHREGNRHRLVEWGQVNEHGQTQSRQHAWARKYWDKQEHASDSRNRLNFGPKIEILGLLREKVTHGEIARRFKRGVTTIGKIAKERAALEEDHALGGRDSAPKSTRGGAFPKVRFSSTVVVVFVVSHIQRIGCQPEKTTLHGGQSRSWSAEQGKENKRKSLAAYPPPPPHPPPTPPHFSFGEK